MSEHEDPAAVREWLFLEPDGELTSDEAARVEVYAAASAEGARERRELAVLGRLIDDSKIQVRDGFEDEVMASLPPAGWSARHPRTWWVAIAALAALGGGAALLTGLAAARLEPGSPFVAAMAAVVDMVASSMAAGAGLLGASWKGIALALGDWIAASAPNAIAFGAVVVGVNWLVWQSLRRRRRAPEATAARGPRKPDVE